MQRLGQILVTVNFMGAGFIPAQFAVDDNRGECKDFYSGLLRGLVISASASMPK